MLRRTPIPVLAMPQGAGVRSLKSWPGNGILCAVELSPRDREDVRAAAEIARAFRRDLTLVRPTAGPPWFVGKLRIHDRTTPVQTLSRA